jgi:hypothetical protein
MEDVVTGNGLPVAAQPWARRVERFIRDDQTRIEQLANNGKTAIMVSGNAVLAAANSVAAQLAAAYEMQRIPATLQTADITVTPSTYFDKLGRPWGRLDVSIVPSDLDLDGNPLIPVAYQVWARVFFVDPGLETDDRTTLGYGPSYQMLGTAPSTNVQVNGLQVGVIYQIRLVAVTSFSVPSAYSDYVTATIPDTLDVMDVPNAPELVTAASVLVATWNGLFGTASPSSQFRYLYAEVSVAGQGVWQRMGASLVRGGGSIQISGLTVGTEYDVRFVAVDSLDVSTESSIASTILLSGIQLAELDPELVTVIESAGGGGTSLTSATYSPTEEDIGQEGDLWFQRGAGEIIIGQWLWTEGAWVPQTLSHEVISSIDLGSATVGTLDGGLITARTLGADQIVAGTITVNELSPTVGDNLNITANGSINFIAGRLEDITDGAQATSDSLDTMQTFYSFGSEGAVISSPNSPFQLALRPDRIDMLEQGASVSYWNSGQMFVRSFVGEEVVLGNHKLEKIGTGTVVRAL